jgi:hypothetical protein
VAASVVIVEERTGRKRRVELTGGGLPLQGANWSGSQLLATAWNPGNTQATQHVLGPQEVPSSWDFEWNTTRLIRSPVAVFDPERSGNYTLDRAHSLALLLEDIFRGGALLKVSWISSASAQSQSSPRQVRIGRAESWDFEYDRPDDIHASVTFAWIGRGEDQPKASDVREGDLSSSLQAAITACLNAANAIQKHPIRTATAPTTFTIGQLEAIADAPLQLVDSFARAANGVANRLKHIGDIILKVKETPAAILGRIVDVANNGLSIANSFLDQVSREGPETQATRNKLNILTQTASYFSGAQTQADLMADVLERLSESARSRRSSIVSAAGTSRRQDKMRVDDSFKIHLPRPGETMLSIAQQYYGNADLADEIAIANGLPGYTVVPPRGPLVIPTRRNLEESNRNRV